MISELTRMATGPEDDGLDDLETGVATRTRPKTKKPSNYKVLMLNDDYTPMEFVVLVLQQFFSMGIEDATRVMLQVHQQGVAVCGVFTYEVAETKVTQVIDFARENQHPLQCTLEKASASDASRSPEPAEGMSFQSAEKPGQLFDKLRAVGFLRNCPHPLNPRAWTASGSRAGRRSTAKSRSAARRTRRWRSCPARF
jgi:ATP-dependent Clp protease adaptor protein ClpS